jgi:Na+/melibiose symporter-like transporter
MIDYFGKGNSATGYQYTMGIFAVFAVMFFFITFSSTKERIQPDPQQKATVKEHFKDLRKNRPWFVMFILTLILFITLSMRGSVIKYYFDYYVSTDDPTGSFSLFNLFGTVSTIIGIFFSKNLSLKYGKRNVFIFGLIGTALFCVPFIFLPPQSIGLMFASEAIRQFIYGLTIPLLWAMMADVADYSEWKNKRRATGIIFSAIVFSLKAGLGFGGAITGYILSIYGYVPNVTQSEPALNGIVMTMSIFPAITFVLCAACLFFYPITKKLEIQITDELTERRKGYATA